MAELEKAIFENTVIGSPVYKGLAYGAQVLFPATGDFSKADWPGLRAIKIGTTWLLAADLPDPYSVTVPFPGAGPVGVPTGVLVPYAGATPPPGFLACDGAAISRTTYADLFDALGTTWGPGDGSTTFNLPDLQDRFLAGAGDSYALGDEGGADTVTLTSSTIPGHTHTGPSHTHTMDTHTHTGPSHVHSLDLERGGVAKDRIEFGAGLAASTGTVAITATALASNDNQRNTGTRTILAGVLAAGTGNTGATDPGDTNAGGTGATGSTGSGNAHENRPPFTAVNYIIQASGGPAGALVELYY